MLRIVSVSGALGPYLAEAPRAGFVGRFRQNIPHVPSGHTQLPAIPNTAIGSASPRRHSLFPDWEVGEVGFDDWLCIQVTPQCGRGELFLRWLTAHVPSRTFEVAAALSGRLGKGPKPASVGPVRPM